MTDEGKKAWWERLDENIKNILLKQRKLKSEQFMKLLRGPFRFYIRNENPTKIEIDLPPFFSLDLQVLTIVGMILNDSFLQIKNAPFLKDLEIAESEGFKEYFFDSILKLKNIERLAFFDVQYFLVVPNLASLKNLKHLELCEVGSCIDLACVRNTNIEVLVISGYEKVLNLDALLTLKSTLRYVNWDIEYVKIPLSERENITKQLPDVKFIDFIPMSGYI